MQAGHVLGWTGGTSDLMDVTRAEEIGRLDVTLKPIHPTFS